MSEQTTVMNYDPNLVLCGRMALQRVRLVFGQWQYRAEMTIEVGGNCTGLDVIDAAVSNAFDQLLEDDGQARISMFKADDELICDDDEDRGEDWLKGMLIAAEILSLVPEEE